MTYKTLWRVRKVNKFHTSKFFNSLRTTISTICKQYINSTSSNNKSVNDINLKKLIDVMILQSRNLLPPKWSCSMLPTYSLAVTKS